MSVNATVSADDRIKYRALIAAGYSDDEIMVEALWGLQHLIDVRAAVVGEETADLTVRTREDYYSEYLTRSRDNLHRLTDLADVAKEKGDIRSAVGAIRARQDILDRTISVGQDLGFIPKKPQQTQVAILVAEMGNDDLKNMLAAEVAETQALIARHGEIPLAALSSVVPRIAAKGAVKRPPEMPAAVASTPTLDLSNASCPSDDSLEGLAALARSVVQRKRGNALPRSVHGAGSGATPQGVRP